MGQTVVGVAFYVVVVLGALVALRASARGREPSPPRPSAAAGLLWLAVAVPSLLQLAVPGLYDALARDVGRIREGELWRLVTSAVVQDGDLFGAVSNLVILAIAVTTASAYWGGRRTWLTFWAAVVGSNLLVLRWQPDGGGNSMATLALTCAVASNALLSMARRWVLAPALGMFAAVALIAVAGNYHAAACALGVVLGLLPAHGPRMDRASGALTD